MRSLGRHVRFFGRFLDRPGPIGAVAPSSARLARTIVSGIGLESADAVAELGPGDGAFTPFILDRLVPGARFFAVESDPLMRRRLEERLPHLDVAADSAENLPAQMRTRGLPSLDAVVCGLPWASFPPDLQDRLLTAIESSLSPNGRFATFAYLQGLVLPAGRRFRRRLGDAFGRIERSPIVWANLPPAFVYRCWK